MLKLNKKLQKIKVTEDDFKDFSKIVSIPKNLNKSMVLYITTWQEVPDDSQETDTMTTKPEWFKEFEQEQNKRWKRQEKFNEMQEKRWKEQEKFNKMQEKHWEEQRKFNERILSLVEKAIERIDNLVVKNNLRE